MSEMGETKERLQGKDPSDVWQDLLVESAADPNLRVTLYEGGLPAAILNGGSDDLPDGINQVVDAGLKYGYNGSRWDRWRNNTELTVLASGTRTTDGSSSELTNHNARGVILFIDVTAVSGTNPTLDIRIIAVDPVTGTTRDMCFMPDLSATGKYLMIMYPGATESGTVSFGGAPVVSGDLPLPRTWKVGYSLGGTNPSFTFSVGGSYVV